MPLRRCTNLNRMYFLTLMVTDMLILALAILLGVRLRFGAFITESSPVSAMIGTWVFLTIAQITGMMVEDLYAVRTTVNRAMNIYRTVRMLMAISVVFIVTLFVTHFPKTTFIHSRLTVLYTMIIWTSLTVISRLMLIPKLFGRFLNLIGFRRIPMIIFGPEKMCGKVKSTFQSSPVYRKALDCRICTDELPSDPDERFRSCMSFMEGIEFGEMVMIFGDDDFNAMSRFSLLVRREGLPFVILSRKIIELNYFDPWLTLGGYGAVSFCSMDWNAGSRFTWRVVDLAAAIIGLVLFSPVMILAAIAISLTSRGGILYRQKRIGLDKKPFTFFKFRSMKVGMKEKKTQHMEYFKKYVNGTPAEDSKEGKVFKTVDPRAVTPVGRIIRRTSIDELPQIFNVLRGEMSIVGPRPCIDYELEHYDREWLQQRFTVKPGLTGIWQVYGRSRLDFQRSQFLDFVYVISRTDGLNLRLILKTFPVMLFGKGGL